MSEVAAALRVTCLTGLTLSCLLPTNALAQPVDDATGVAEASPTPEPAFPRVKVSGRVMAGWDYEVRRPNRVQKPQPDPIDPTILGLPARTRNIQGVKADND